MDCASCFIVTFIFSHQFADDKSPFYYVDVNNIRCCYLWKSLKLILVNAPSINNNNGNSVNIALKVDEREFPFR